MTSASCSTVCPEGKNGLRRQVLFPPKVNVEINEHHYNKGHYLADDIYFQWSILVKTIPNPVEEKRKRFAQEQESARKDVERAFGVLQSRWGIVRYHARTWSAKKLWEVMTACMIMHKMIVHDERPERIYDQGFQFQGENIVPKHGGATTLIIKCVIGKPTFSYKMI